MGSRFGYMFKVAGQDVTLIDKWQDHVSIINRSGLTVNDNGVTKICRIPAVLPDRADGHYDLILVLTKAMQLDVMMKSIRPIIDERTNILILSNGIGNIETLEKYVSKEQIYAGVTLWTSELDGPGKVTLTGSGSIELQKIGEGSDQFFQALIDTMNQAGFNAKVSRNVLVSIWQKAALNSVLNTYCTILSCNIGQFGGLENAVELLQPLVNECVTVAHSSGVMIDRDAILKAIGTIFDPKMGGDHYPSMYQDLHSKRRTEVDFLNGAFSRMGDRLHIATPYNHLLTDLIHAKEHLARAN